MALLELDVRDAVATTLGRVIRNIEPDCARVADAEAVGNTIR